VGIGEACIGRMMTAMGDPCDEHGELKVEVRVPVFRASPSLMDRAPINRFLPTGTKVVDMLMPLGCGQRQLVLGDRMTGKTSVALDAIINQHGRDVVCVYCCVGKSVSGLEKTMSLLLETKALDYTVVVVATDNAPVAEQYIVPFTASAVGDYFAQQGRDVLVVFDDMTKHAWAYRQVSLLLDRPPGREAYPGDIFYLHTQLMEQAGCFNENHGSGTMTFLAIAETQQGDMTGYIPSNLVSMCDGQVVLSSAIYGEGIRPAVDAQMSLSIVGGRAQPPILKALTGSLRADYALYFEVARLSRLSTLSDSAARTMKRGESIRDVLQQGHHAICSTGEMVLLLYALKKGMLDELQPELRRAFCDGIHAFAVTAHSGQVTKIEESRELTPEIEDMLEQIIKDYFAQEQHDAEALA
jgi:F-type H+-transporting ATPase subunit alpha